MSVGWSTRGADFSRRQELDCGHAAAQPRHASPHTRSVRNPHHSGIPLADPCPCFCPCTLHAECESATYGPHGKGLPIMVSCTAHLSFDHRVGLACCSVGAAYLIMHCWGAHHVSERYHVREALPSLTVCCGSEKHTAGRHPSASCRPSRWLREHLCRPCYRVVRPLKVPLLMHTFPLAVAQYCHLTATQISRCYTQC